MRGTIRAALLRGVTVGLCAVAACSDSEPDVAPDSALDAGTSTPDAAAADAADAAPNDAAVDPQIAPDEPVVCTVHPCALEIAGAKTQYCARLDDGTLRCWGRDDAGQLGRGEVDGAAPSEEYRADAPVVLPAKAKQLAVGASTVCAIDEAGDAWCWGSNSGAELGLGTRDTAKHATPVRVILPGKVASIDVVAGQVCSVLVSGELWCWGRSVPTRSGQLTAPVRIEALGAISHVSGSLALAKDGSVYSWGEPLGRESSLTSAYPALIPNLEGVDRIASAVGYVGCALAGRDVRCWGRRDVVSPYLHEVPTMLALPDLRGGTVQRLAVADRNVCLRITDGTLKCLGANSFGQLGAGRGDEGAFVPVAIPSGRAVQVAMASSSICALLTTGAVECWGSNADGHLAQGSTDRDAHPTAMRVAF